MLNKTITIKRYSSSTLVFSVLELQDSLEVETLKLDGVEVDALELFEFEIDALELDASALVVVGLAASRLDVSLHSVAMSLEMV